MNPQQRRDRLGELWGTLGIDPAVLGPPEETAAIGPDHRGRYERVFSALRRELEPFRAALEELLALSNPQEQARRVDRRVPLGAAIDQALNSVMSQANLVAVFGPEATRNPRQSFASHFAERLRAILGKPPAAGNPFLTFRRFLATLGTEPAKLDVSALWPEVRAFNSVLSSACVLDELEVGVGCMGIIEHAFASVSAAIGGAVLKRGWVASADLTHYKLHEEIDERHADEFYVVIEARWNDPARRYFIEQGLELGAYAFNRLYTDLYARARSF